MSCSISGGRIWRVRYVRKQEIDVAGYLGPDERVKTRSEVAKLRDGRYQICRLQEMEDVHNANNRWEVAATLNLRLGTGPGPFWCVPAAHASASLTRKRNEFPCGGLQEFRLVEQRLRASGRSAQSAWKLFTAGSVGSQALLGIPILESLRSNAALAGVSRVWPFDTGSTATPSPERGPCLVHAEIWPGAFPVHHHLHEVPDAAQVWGLAERFAHEDAAGTLGRCFEIDADEVTAREEGWILGA